MRFFCSNKSRLYPFEALVVEAVKFRLNSEAALRLQMQVDGINEVQRLVNGREVNLYRLVRGKPAFDAVRFPRGGEALLGTVTLVQSGSPTALKADTWLANGRLFSLMFNKPPQQFFLNQALDSAQSDVAEAKVWIDPMAESLKVGEITLEVDPKILKGWQRNVLARCKFKGLRSPLIASERTEYIAQIDAQLPEDYLELNEHIDGLGGEKLTVRGLAEIRKIALACGNFYILAEDERCALAVKGGSKGGEIYHLSFEEETAMRLGKSFREALEMLCG